MSKPGKVLKGLCKKLGVRLTVKRGKKRMYKSVKVLKAQCKRKQKKKKKRKVKRKRRFGSIFFKEDPQEISDKKKRIEVLKKIFEKLSINNQQKYVELERDLITLIKNTTDFDVDDCINFNRLIFGIEEIDARFIPKRIYELNNKNCWHVHQFTNDDGL